MIEALELRVNILTDCHMKRTWMMMMMMIIIIIIMGRDSAVGIATRYGAGRSGDRIPVRAKFSASFQTGPGAHPGSYTMGTGSFPGVKRQGRGVDHQPTSSAEVKERVEL
jgi:hypothetical protein